MRHRLPLVLLAACLAVSGCSKLERLTIVRPSAARGDYTQVAPTYDVSGKQARARAADPAQLLMSASDLYQRGDFVQAQALAQRALKADPHSGDAHTLLGAIADAGGNADAAGAHYAKAVGIAPKTGIYANNYGSWLCANGRPAESLDWFDTAIADPAYPTRANAFANAGSCAQRAGQPDRAEANWRQALASPVRARRDGRFRSASAGRSCPRRIFPPRPPAASRAAPCRASLRRAPRCPRARRRR